MAQSLETIHEVAHHSSIVGYCQYNFSDKPASILEVGCGNGSLHERLKKTYPYSRYLGIDASPDAIEQALTRARSASEGPTPETALTLFQQADPGTFTSPEQFDVIIFRETLLALSDPLQTLQRYEPMLSPGGLIIVSLSHSHQDAPGVWRGIDQRYDIQDAILLEHLPTGRAWTIKAMHLPEPGKVRVENAQKLPPLWVRLKDAVYSWLPLSFRQVGITPEAYDESYRAGKEPDFADTTNIARYAVMIGYANFLFQDRACIFDVGCGPGVLRDRLERVPYRRYLGIDFASEAIARARPPHEDRRSRLLQADATTYRSEEQFDLIVFMDVLYYLTYPIDVLSRYEKSLDPGGVFVVCMHNRNKRAPEIWQEIDARYKMLDQIRIETFFNNGVFTIKLFQR
jgi:2-polyprenyl-3-methyl-5-hydroxy-6-metoxy-1,4-benzoquinol methylase